MINNPNFHLATNVDYQNLITVWENAVVATHDFLSEKDIKHYKSLILSQYFDQVKLFYLKNDNEILGFIGISDKFIQMLFVEPKFMGLGIGKKLINFAITNFSADKVDVNEQNIQALEFYKHLGFKVIDRYSHDDAGKAYPILSMALLA